MKITTSVFLFLAILAMFGVWPEQPGWPQVVGDSTEPPPAEQWSKHFLGITQASTIDFGHLGIHTHANFLTFDTGTTDVAAMQADAQRFRNVLVVGHSTLNTDHAALPPEDKDFAQAYGPVPNPFGPIDGDALHGKHGWSSTAFTIDGRHRVRFAVPTRFANWVAEQPKKTQKKYLSLGSYSLRVTWLQPD